MLKGKESVKMIRRQCIGIARQQNKGLPKPNIIWVRGMFKGKASAKMIHRQLSGIVRRQNRDLQQPNIIWV